MKTLFLLPLLFSSPAWAVGDFSGHWLATSGKISSNIGLKGTCSKVEIIIEQTPDNLHTEKYSAKCSLFDSDWGPIDQTIRNGKVFEGDEEVGTITEDTFKTMAPDGNVSYAYNMKLIRNADGSFSMDSYYGTGNGFGAIVIEATLQKVKP